MCRGHAVIFCFLSAAIRHVKNTMFSVLLQLYFHYISIHNIKKWFWCRKDLYWFSLNQNGSFLTASHAWLCVCSISHGEQMEVHKLENKGVVWPAGSQLRSVVISRVLSWHSNSLIIFPLALSLCSLASSRMSLAPFSLSAGNESVKTYWRKSSVWVANRKLHLSYFSPLVIMSRAECVLSKLNSGSINKPLCPPLVLIRC